MNRSFFGLGVVLPVLVLPKGDFAILTVPDVYCIVCLLHRGLAQHQEGDAGYYDGECKTAQYALVGAHTVGKAKEEQEGFFYFSIEVECGKCKVNQRKPE